MIFRLAATAIGILLAAAVAAEPPTLPPGKGEACVAPTDVMRSDHMDFLLHQRDRTVHDGIRTPRFSLTGCIDCHAQRDDNGAYIPVDAPDQFCAACHEYASVKIDCFECHATAPDTPREATAGHGGLPASVQRFGGVARNRAGEG